MRLSATWPRGRPASKFAQREAARIVCSPSPGHSRLRCWHLGGQSVITMVSNATRPVWLQHGLGLGSHQCGACVRPTRIMGNLIIGLATTEAVYTSCRGTRVSVLGSWATACSLTLRLLLMRFPLRPRLCPHPRPARPQRHRRCLRQTLQPDIPAPLRRILPLDCPRRFPRALQRNPRQEWQYPLSLR